MAPSFSIPNADAVAFPFISGLPTYPAPGVFWVVFTWGIIPGVFLIWIAYHRRRERLRAVRRKLRQLEIRLAASTPAQSAHAAALPRPGPGARPSSLTARILLPPSVSTSPLPRFPKPLPGHAG